MDSHWLSALALALAFIDSAVGNLYLVLEFGVEFTLLLCKCKCRRFLKASLKRTGMPTATERCRRKWKAFDFARRVGSEEHVVVVVVVALS